MTYFDNYKQKTNIQSVIIKSVLSELNNPKNYFVTTKEIIKRLDYSQEYIIRLFKLSNLDSPNKIFLKNKLNYACTFLRNSEIKIIDIAEMCGIYTISYFNKVFKEEFGISPSNYRKKYKTNIPTIH
jgi:AraC-like DNA-binding protein